MAIEEEDLEQQAALPDFLRDPLGIPGRRWLPMLLAALLGTIAGGVYVALWEPTYKATTKLLVAGQAIPASFVKTTVEENPFNQLNRMVGEVLSRAKLSAIIAEYDLYPELQQSTSMGEIVGIMRRNITLKADDARNRPRLRAPATSLLYKLQFVYGEPELAAEVANAIAALFLEAGIKSRMEQAGEISKFLRVELVDANRELEEQEALIAEFMREYRGELPSELGSNMGRLQRLQDQRQSLAVQIAEAETRIATMAVTSADAGSPRARLQALRNELDTQLAVHTEEHPNVIALQRQVDALESQVANAEDSGAGDSIDAVIAQSRISLALQREELARTESELQDLDARVSRTPKRQEELDSLERIATVKRTRYIDMMHKVEEAELAEQLETSKHGANISVMDRAHPPSQPQRARVVVALMMAVLVVGGTAGIGLLFELLDPVMVDGEQSERMAGVPVLGSIPRIS
jgi:uncharacterized protein involved in exopolysaccharide biosynthesis